MRLTGFQFAFLLAALAGRGAIAADAPVPKAEDQCNGMQVEIDKVLIGPKDSAPLAGFDGTPVCVVSAQSPIAKTPDQGGNVCTATYHKLSELSKQLKQAIADAGTKSKGFKLDCNDTPEKCRNFYDQNAEQINVALKSETELQPTLKQFMDIAGRLERLTSENGIAYRAYYAYAAKLSDVLNKAPNLQQATTLSELNGAKAAPVGAANLGEAWLKLAGVPYSKSSPANPDGPLFKELAKVRTTAARAQKFAYCKLAESKQKVASLGTNMKKLGDNSRNSGTAGRMVQKTGGGDKSTITGNTSKGGGQAAPAPASQGGGGGMDAINGLMQQASKLAGQLNQQGKSASPSNAASTAAPAATAASAAPATATTANAQPTSYALYNPSIGTAGASVAADAPTTTSGSSKPASDGVVAFAAGSPTSSGGASPALASRATSGASGQGATAASASASGGGSANVSSGSVGAPSMSAADSQKTSENGDTAASTSGGMPGFGGGASSSGGGSAGAGDSAASAGALKSLDAQFNAASANLGAKFDLAPLPTLPPLDGAATEATSATPPSSGPSASTFAEQIPGLDAAVAAAAADPGASAAEAAPGHNQATVAQKRGPSAAHSPSAISSSPDFLGSDNVSLFQRIHTTHERAVRRLQHPVAAAL